MDEDRESSTPPWPGRETIGHGFQHSAEPQSGSNGQNAASGAVQAGSPPSAGGAFTEARLIIPPASPEAPQDVGGREVDAPRNGAAPLDEETPLDFDYDEAVPGFEAAASDCLNRALAIARSLNHVVLSSDHLMIALTMDPNARRQLERVGDVTQLREAAMQRLGKMHSRYSTGDSFPSQTADLKDIRNAARQAAAEREQLVAINDLINAYSKANGRLTYGSGDGSQALALMGKIEQGLVPRVADAMTRIETLVRDALERQQTVQSMLQDLNARHWEETERRQREFMDEIRRQVREAADAQFAAVLSELTARLSPEPTEEPLPEEPPIAEDEARLTPPSGPAPEPAARPRSYWSWLVL
jgi:hypothetical protein